MRIVQSLSVLPDLQRRLARKPCHGDLDLVVFLFADIEAVCRASAPDFATLEAVGRQLVDYAVLLKRYWRAQREYSGANCDLEIMQKRKSLFESGRSIDWDLNLKLNLQGVQVD